MELFIPRRPLVIMLLVATAVTVMGQMENMSDGKVDNSSQLEVGKGRGHPNKPLRSSQPLRSGPRGRRKNIWSYNLGHRSLAFLVAGEVEVGTPPTMGLDQRCVGCCGAGETLIGRRSADLNIPNTIRRSVTQKKELTGIGTEPNSVADPCLGCCVIHMTPTPAQAKQTTPGIAAGTDRAPRRQTPNQPWTGQAATGRDAREMCSRKGCLQDWSSESSSSSEETSEEVFHGARNSRVGSRRTMIKQKPGNPCRYLGCRSPLGSFSDSSSEED